MKKHTKIYFEYFGFCKDEFIPCEVCGTRAVDIHHIDCRGMGGTEKNNIENLMALCRSCHVKYGDNKLHNDFLQHTHNKNLC